MKRDVDYGEGLTLLADPEPNEWLADTGQVLSAEWYGRPVYGNFWARRPCKLRPHQWKVLRLTEWGAGWPREIRRCQRCGSQVHQAVGVLPPRRGEI